MRLPERPMELNDYLNQHFTCACGRDHYASLRAVRIGAGIRSKSIHLQHLGFDEATLGEITVEMPMDCDLVVAVGTGAINGMTRLFSYRLGRPFFTVTTAAPMDGFASSVAAIQYRNLKTACGASM